MGSASVDLADTVLDTQGNEIADVPSADPGGGRDIAYGFPVAAVEAKGDADLLAVVSGDLEPVRAPARIADIDRDPAVV